MFRPESYPQDVLLSTHEYFKIILEAQNLQVFNLHGVYISVIFTMSLLFSDPESNQVTPTGQDLSTILVFHSICDGIKIQASVQPFSIS